MRMTTPTGACNRSPRVAKSRRTALDVSLVTFDAEELETFDAVEAAKEKWSWTRGEAKIIEDFTDFTWWFNDLIWFNMI